MAFCTNCGNQIEEGASFCQQCGTATGNAPANANNQPVEEGSTFGWGVLGFFVPLVGLILFLIWKDEYPKRSKSAGVGALVSVIAVVALYILLFALMFIFAMAVPAAVMG